MNKRQDLFLKPLENFFTSPNLETLKNQFYEDFLDEIGSVPGNCLFIDEGVWRNDEFFPLKSHILGEYYKVFSYIRDNFDTTILSTPTEDIPKLSKYVETSFRYIVTTYQSFLDDYPEVTRSFKSFKQYLLRRYSITITLKQNSKFTPDSNFGYIGTLPNLKKLYRLSVNSGIFDTDIDTFIEVLTKENSTSYIKFKTSTPIMVGYLEIISRLFRNMDIRNIVSSRKFVTRSDDEVFITSENYYTATTRLKKKPEEKKMLENILQFVDLQTLKKK
ncbi:hypothetical protein C1637_10120 [Chryseobacterium lactis]|uniref:Uncharacterized protein n=2 Tax=Chryseobacterium TaxID=59732 RepID=A0A3G6RKF1_CHRLC|nr:hypothetical protein [Chryseobacterium lactis]AZA82133.1 hypothetical protein EG342_09575 [Chryseobacterium lactis]AZB02514.1 hypothetical protein EG341_00430 [Chryseobacterium lactis]PNW14190.1 hypothetical protein C1637_10120 [Chryseobacterium lactis]